MNNHWMQVDLIIVVVVAVVVVIVTQSINLLSVEASSSVAMAIAAVASGKSREPAFNGSRATDESLPELKRVKRRLSKSKKQSLDDNDSNSHNFHDDDDDDDDDDELKPTFLASNQNVTVSPGDKASLICRVLHLGKKTVTWRRRGDIHPMTIGRFIFVSDTRLKVEQSEFESSDWQLIINDVRPADDGTYQCQINTKDDQYNHFDVHLQVKTVDVRGTDVVERGSPIELWCNASGRPEPPHNIEWFKDGQMIESNSAAGVIVTKKIETHLLLSTLLIRRSKMADAGTYQCRTTTTTTSSSSSSSLLDLVSGHSLQSQSGGTIAVRILSAPMEKRADRVFGLSSSSSDRLRRLSSLCSVLCSYFGWMLRQR